jgi:imidazolonepropionase-like amidohydrolase
LSATWLHGATLVTATGADPAPAGLLIEDGLIARIGGDPPRGAEVVECAGLTITPGLIDAHVHLGMSSAIDASINYGMSAAEIAADMFANCSQTLYAGFTTVRDCGGIDAGLPRAVDAGKVVGPRILQCGPIHCQTGGHGHFAPDWEPTDMWCARDIPGLRSLSVLSDGPEQMRKNARESFRRGAQFLKLCVTGGVISKHDELTDTQFTVDEIAAAVAEATARGAYVTVHAHNTTGIRNAVKAGARGVEHGTGIDEETAELMAANQVALVPTLAAVEAVLGNAVAGLPPEVAARATHVRDAMVSGLLAAKQAGVRVGSGSDLVGPVQGHRGEELVLRAAVESPMEALMSATRTNADILGIADQIGTLEVGKRADVVAFAGDPLENPKLFADPSSVVLVVQDGVVVKDTRA